MGAKEYLVNIRRIREIIREDERQVQEIEEKILRPAGIDYSKEKVRESFKPGDPVLKAIELRDELTARKADYFAQVKAARDLIHQIDNRRAAVVLIEYYLYDKTPGEIALTHHMSDRHIRRLHDEGLNELEKIMNL